MYKARFTNSKGRTFLFGYENGNIFDISGLTGHEVDIAFSQGFNQIGETAENLSVKSRDFEITGRLLGEAAQSKKNMLSVFAPMENGRLFFEDKYYIDCVVKYSPIITVETRDPRFELVLSAPYPYWQNVKTESFVLGGYDPDFFFPKTYRNDELYYFGRARLEGNTNIFNSGEVDVFFKLEIESASITKNPIITNVGTGEFLKLNATVNAGEKYSIYQSVGGLFVDKETNGAVEDAFAVLDEDSNLFTLHAGDNVFEISAESGKDGLIVSATFSSAVVGVYEGM